jgi:hypothetical protein
MKTVTATKSCAQCQHWNPEAGGKGECRAHAPQTIVFKIDDKTQFETVFPVTSESDWCGEFAQK